LSILSSISVRIFFLIFNVIVAKQVNKFSEISSRCFPRVKHNLLQKF
jgi:hypothetical protein